jgi:hypothetical protein
LRNEHVNPTSLRIGDGHVLRTGNVNEKSGIKGT